MNSTSLTGKKWIYREFNNDDIVFYKENICFGGATIVQVGESIYEKNKKNLA